MNYSFAVTIIFSSNNHFLYVLSTKICLCPMVFYLIFFAYLFYRLFNPIDLWISILLLLFFFFFFYNIILFFTNLLLHWYFELHLFLFYLSMVFGSCFNEWTNTIGCVSITTWVSSYSVIIFSMIWLWFKMFWRAAKICLIQIPKGATMLIVTPSKMHLIVIYASTSRIVISLNYPLDLLYS